MRTVEEARLLSTFETGVSVSEPGGDGAGASLNISVLLLGLTPLLSRQLLHF